MSKTTVKTKFFISGGLMLLFMFIHLVGIIETCEHQVKTNTITVSAFNG